MMKIDEIKKTVITQFGGNDPFADPASWALIEKRIPNNHWGLLIDCSGAFQFAAILPEIFKAENFVGDTEAHLSWERIGNYYKNQGRLHEALLLYFGLYYYFIKAQDSSGMWVQKATPLVWREMGSSLRLILVVN